MNKAIVMQGKFSINTQLILEHYLNTNTELVILSSYVDSPVEVLDDLLVKYENFRYTLIKQPDVLGKQNRNAQRLTSYHGINYAKSLKIDYVLKCRTDHVFKCINILRRMWDYLKQYPIDLGDQKERIIVGNAGTTLEEKWGTYHISDFWMFGHVNDLLGYFDIYNPFWDNKKEFNYMTPYKPAGKPFPSPEPELCNLWIKHKNIKGNLKQILIDRFAVYDVNNLNYSKHAKIKVNNIMECITIWDNHMDPKTVHQKIWQNWL